MTGAPTQPCGEERRRRRALVAAIVIPALFAAILYLPSLWGGWVMDDKAQIRDDTLIHTASSWGDLLTLRILGRDVIDGHRPVQLASLMIDSVIWGRNPLGYRLTSLLLHALCTALVAWVALRLLRESPRWRGGIGEQGPTVLGVGQAITAALATMLFAAHPLAVEAAAVPTNREDLLVTFFTLMAMACVIGLDPSRGWSVWLRGAACVLCCFLAVGSKESGVAAATAVVLYSLVTARRRRAMPWVVLSLCCILAVAMFLWARFAMQPKVSEIFTEPTTRIGANAWEILNVQVRIWTFQARQIIWPDNLSIIYDSGAIAGISIAVGWCVVLGIAAIAAILMALDRRLVAVVGAMAAAMATVANLIPIFNPIADRYLYTPLAMLAIVLCLVIGSRLPRLPGVVRACFLSVGVVAVVLLTFAAHHRISLFDHDVRLLEATNKATPSLQARQSLGYAYIEADRAGEAIPLFEALTAKRSDYCPYWMALSVALEMEGRSDEADQVFLRAVEIDPGKALAIKPPSPGYVFEHKDYAWERVVGRYRHKMFGTPMPAQK